MRVPPRGHGSARAGLLAAFLLLGACSGQAITEDSPTAVTVRYDPLVSGIDEATALAQRACARHGKTARLRKLGFVGIGAERFGHFDCI